MKKILLMAMMCCSITLFAQKKIESKVVCNFIGLPTTNRMANNAALHQLRVASSSDEICVKVRLHRITKVGIDPINAALIESQISYLNSIFQSSTSGISFYTEDPINDLEYDEIFDNGADPVITIDNVTTVNFGGINLDEVILNEEEYLDLFFANTGLGGASFSYGIAGRPSAFINIYGINTEIVVHEVGHVFGLFHTYHGTIANGQNQGNGTENDDGWEHYPDFVECPSTNPNHTGDFIPDTPTDLGSDSDNYNIDTENCKVSHTGTNFCSEEVPDPPIFNYMRSGTFSCWESFTSFQYSRMKSFLENELIAITECPPSPCLDCTNQDNGIDVMRDYIFGSLSTEPQLIYEEDCSSASIDFPMLLPEGNCDYTYFLKANYNGDDYEFNQEILSQSSFNIEFIYGNTEVILDVFYQGEPLQGSCEYFATCDSDSCNECEVVNDFAIGYNSIGFCNFNFRAELDNGTCSDNSFTHQWVIKDSDGNEIFESNTANFSYEFTQSGVFEVCLTSNYIDDMICSNTICETIVIDETCDTSCNEDCLNVADAIRGALSLNNTGICTEVCFTPPSNFGDCFTGTIYWGDGSTSDLNNLAYLICHEYESEGNYTITIEVDNGSEKCEVEKDVGVTCNDNCDDLCPIDASFDFYTEDGCTYNFVADQSTISCPDQYNFYWYVNGFLESTSPSFNKDLSSGEYFISFVLSYHDGNDNLLCRDTQNKTLTVDCVEKKSSKIKLYPNPLKPNQELFFQGLDFSSIVAIEIYDLFGIPKMRFKPSKNWFKLPKLKHGIYFAKFYTKDGVEQKKIIVK